MIVGLSAKKLFVERAAVTKLHKLSKPEASALSHCDRKLCRLAQSRDRKTRQKIHGKVRCRVSLHRRAIENLMYALRVRDTSTLLDSGR